MRLVARCRPRALVCAQAQLVVLVSGCSSWKVQLAPPPEVIAKQHPPKLRVTKTDHSEVVFENPEIRGDTLIEVPTPSSRGAVAPASRPIPLADITRVAVRGRDEGKTFLLVIGSLAVVGGVLYAVAYSAATSSGN